MVDSFSECEGDSEEREEGPSGCRPAVVNMSAIPWDMMLVEALSQANASTEFHAALRKVGLTEKRLLPAGVSWDKSRSLYRLQYPGKNGSRTLSPNVDLDSGFCSLRCSR